MNSSAVDNLKCTFLKYLPLQNFLKIFASPKTSLWWNLPYHRSVFLVEINTTTWQTDSQLHLAQLTSGKNVKWLTIS